MICNKCKENIEQGEAVIPERINGSEHYWFFHPHCYTARNKERDAAEERLRFVASMARQVH